MITGTAIFVAGVFAWTFLEYLIHAWLSHIFDTFATPLHQVHHRDPHAVFTIGGWIPVAIAWIGGLALWGFAPGMVFATGMVAGFAAYEALHYRIHFARPRNRVERWLRMHHLVHHYRAPSACFGVTSAMWDLIFATEPAGAEMRQWRESVADVPPLEGPSNAHRLFHFGIPAAR
ncbi:MAG: sterol desaturase family protein [Candidatus Binataceae bacterium]